MSSTVETYFLLRHRPKWVFLVSSAPFLSLHCLSLGNTLEDKGPRLSALKAFPRVPTVVQQDKDLTSIHDVSLNWEGNYYSQVSILTCSWTERESSQLLPLSMMSAMSLSLMASVMLRYAPGILSLLRVFIMSGCWILSKPFSASVEMIMVFYFAIC